MALERTAWEPPAELDGFRIIGLIGAGAMGRVYLAHDTFLERDVAIKFIAAERPDIRAIERFLIEARAIARLQHPNVVSIYRIGEVAGRPYLAYELVRGTTLEHVRRPMPWREVLKIGVGLARGLAAAHSRGILHRDIKPANIMLSDAGEVKLVDFGIAKLVGSESAAAEGSTPEAPPAPLDLEATQTDTSSPLGGTPREPAQGALTQAGVVIGTPRYIAPERWSGQPATPRSEVFSLGLVLYEVCTGSVGDRRQLPVEGTTRAQEAPLAPLRSLAPEVPPELADVIDRALRIDPDARFASPEEVRDALELVAERLSSARAAARSGTRYARNGDVSLAYQVFGSGPTDLVVVPGFVSHLDLSWEEPSFAAFLERLGRRHRVIMFDKRGTGLSDRVEISSLGDRVDDVRAVMDAAASERAVIFGQSEGGVLALMFAALYPERTRALILYATSARSLVGHDYPAGMEPALFEWAYEEIRQKWGGPVFLEQEAPSRLGDAAFVEWWARYLKMGASPGAAIALLQANARIDVRHLLPGIRVPTLVLHRKGDQLMNPGGGRYLAEHIPGARLELLEGSDHIPFIGDSESFLAAVEAFNGAEHVAPTGVPLIATVLVANPIGRHWDELDKPTREAFKRLFIENMSRWGGSELDTSRHGQLVLAFRTPMAALSCAAALVDGAARIGVPGAAALHLDVLTGRDQAPGKEVIDRVAALAWSAAPGQILATRIVRDLATRTTLRFEPIAGDSLATDALFTVQPAPRPEPPPRSDLITAPTGPRKVRLAVAQGFGKLLAPHLRKLRSEAPDLLVETLTSNNFADLMKGEADLAIRVGPFTAPGLLITPVGEVGWSLFASHEYLARRGAPADLDNLAGHDLIGYSESLARTASARWIAEHGAGANIVLECDDGADVVDAGRAGLGIAVLPCLIGSGEPGLVRLTPSVVARREIMLVQTYEQRNDPAITRVVAALKAALIEHAHLLLGDATVRSA